MSIWCVIANIPRDDIGTKHFSSGTKLYVLPVIWGDGAERLRVVGKHRGTAKLIEMIIASKDLTDWRAKEIFSPSLIERFDDWTELRAQKFVTIMRSRL